MLCERREKSVHINETQETPHTENIKMVAIIRSALAIALLASNAGKTPNSATDIMNKMEGMGTGNTD